MPTSEGERALHCISCVVSAACDSNDPSSWLDPRTIQGILVRINKNKEYYIMALRSPRVQPGRMSDFIATLTLDSAEPASPNS